MVQQPGFGAKGEQKGDRDAQQGEQGLLGPEAAHRWGEVGCLGKDTGQEGD